MEVELTPEILLQAVQAGKPEDRLNVDPATIRYAVYARKSTQGDEKQERSIKDQVYECVDKVLTPLNIAPVEVIQEKFSAKEPDTRVLFKKLISDIKAGKITGLVAWHPDRLARNMKDAGEIIDLLDKGVLKDLKFATSTFENNSAGKMLLGISFVLAKQYSENLSQNVNRGNNRYTEDAGEYLGKQVHGYYIDPVTRHLLPDENSFTLIKRLFQMRIEGFNQRELMEWINEQGYMVRRKGKDPKPFVFKKDDISDLLKRPVYAGVLDYGLHAVILMEKYDFTPMISVKDYYKINKTSALEAGKIIAAKRIKRNHTQADLLRGRVFCGTCSKAFTSMLIPKKKAGEVIETRYYYRCENKQCEMYNKSVAAKKVIEKAADFFATFLFTTKGNYNSYVKQAKEEIRYKNIELESQISSLLSRINQIVSKYEQTKELLTNSPSLAEHYNLDAIKLEENNLRAEYAKLIAQQTASKDVILTYENYLKLFSSTSEILLKTQDMKVMDALLKKFFSNFTVTGQNGRFSQGSEVTFELKEPWKGFLNNDDFVYGAGTGTLTLDLFLGKEAL